MSWMIDKIHSPFLLITAAHSHHTSPWDTARWRQAHHSWRTSLSRSHLWSIAGSCCRESSPGIAKLNKSTKVESELQLSDFFTIFQSRLLHLSHRVARNLRDLNVPEAIVCNGGSTGVELEGQGHLIGERWIRLRINIINIILPDKFGVWTNSGLRLVWNLGPQYVSTHVNLWHW